MTSTLKRSSYYIRCSVCGQGVEEGRHQYAGIDPETYQDKYERTPDVHVDLDSERPRPDLDAAHAPVVDNVGPDGETYSFGRIEDTIVIAGKYAITRSWRLEDDTIKHSYTVYLYKPADKYRAEGWRRQIHSQPTLEHALVFAVSAYLADEQPASTLTRHFLAGLGRA